VPSIPSQADDELAKQATEAGWPTTASQVQDLHEREVLPEKIVRRRGRGQTTSEYPPGSLEVLIAMRRASADRRKHYESVVLAWVRGANIRDTGLRQALERFLDEAHRVADAGVKRLHRKAPNPGVFDPGISDPIERRMVLGVITNLMAGHQPPTALASFAAEKLRPLLDRVIPSLEEATPGGTYPVSPDDREDALARLLSAKSPVEGLLGESLATIDLSLTSAQAFVTSPSTPRELLDRARDTALGWVRDRSLSPTEEIALVGMVVGMVNSMSSLDEWLRRHGTRLTDYWDSSEVES
jgi:hypothetical protein